MSHMGNDLQYLQYTVFPIAFFIIKVKYFFTYKQISKYIKQKACVFTFNGQAKKIYSVKSIKKIYKEIL